MTRAVLLTTLALALAATLAYAGGVSVFYIWPDGVAVEYNATAPSPADFNYTAVVDCATGVGRAVLRAGEAYVVVSLPGGNATAWPPAAVEFAKRLIPTVPHNSTGTLAVDITAKNGTAYARYRGCKVAADPADPRTHMWAVLYYVTLLRSVNLTTACFVGMNNVTVSPTEAPFSAIGAIGFWLNITLPKPPAPTNATAPANVTKATTNATTPTVTATPRNATTTQTPTSATQTVANVTTTPVNTVAQTAANTATISTTASPEVGQQTPGAGGAVTATTHAAQPSGGGDALVTAVLAATLAAVLAIAAVALKRRRR